MQHLPNIETQQAVQYQRARQFVRLPGSILLEGACLPGIAHRFRSIDLAMQADVSISNLSFRNQILARGTYQLQPGLGSRS
jgi:hypothetical protein